MMIVFLKKEYNKWIDHYASPDGFDEGSLEQFLEEGGFEIIKEKDRVIIKPCETEPHYKLKRYRWKIKLRDKSKTVEVEGTREKDGYADVLYIYDGPNLVARFFEDEVEEYETEEI